MAASATMVATGARTPKLRRDRMGPALAWTSPAPAANGSVESQMLPAVGAASCRSGERRRRDAGASSNGSVMVASYFAATFCPYGHQLADAEALVRDRASQFIDAFDEIFRTEGCKVLKTPVRTPVANAFVERWIGTPRRELLDRTIIWNRRQLERLVVDYIDHHNTHRPHRSLDQLPPVATDAADQPGGHLQVVEPARKRGERGG